MKEFITNCIGAIGEDIMEMVDDGEEVTREEFVNNVNSSEFSQLESNLGYSEDFKMETDWHVSYWKSYYRGKKCYYLSQSSIEYIFC